MSSDSRAWILGSKISIAAFENAVGTEQAKTDKDFNEATLAAKEFGITLPPLSPRGIDQAENNNLLRDYLNKKIYQPVGQIIETNQGAREATFFSYELKYNSVYWLFLSGDMQSLKMLLSAFLNVIKAEASFVGIPPEIVADTVKLQIDTDYETAKKTINDAEEKIVGHLLKRQLVDDGDAYYLRHQYAEAVKEYSKAINANADFTEAYSKRATTLMILKLYDSAIADYTKVIELTPKNESAAPPLDVTYIQRCYAYLQNNNLILAESDCARAIRFKPSNDAYFMLGLVHLLQTKYQSAEEDFSFAIILNLSDAQSYYYRGLIYQKTGRKDLSAVDFKKAETLQPGILASHKANY